MPRDNKTVVLECKYELDSIAAFLQLSHDYFSQTGDIVFFRRRGWSDAVDVIMNTTSDLLKGTYAADGTLNRSPFRFERQTNKASETMPNQGAGSPVRSDTGLVRSFFRPSDDACMFQLFIPANMMLERHLSSCADIMEEVNGEAAVKMRGLAEVVTGGIEKYGRVEHGEFGEIYAFEVDGLGARISWYSANSPQNELGEETEAAQLTKERTTRISQACSVRRCWAISTETTKSTRTRGGLF